MHLATDSPGQLDVAGYDGDTLVVGGCQASIEKFPYFVNWMAKCFQGVFIKNLSSQSVSRSCYEGNDYGHPEYLKVAQVVKGGFTKMPKVEFPTNCGL